jgi:arylsulfatase
MALKPPVTSVLMLLTLVLWSGVANAQDKKPNIVVIWGDDIGQSNISAYTHGLMGYQTPHIDRLAKEGMMFTDYYAEQSCTAGRAAFITGQSVFRTGNSKVGLPGAKQGLNFKDPTIAELLKPMGYATAQYGKNHLGDRNEYLPTVHGFDEFYGVLYHLNAMQDIFSRDYPKGDFLKEQGPRGVIDSTKRSHCEPRTSSSARPSPTSRSSSGSTSPTCTCGPTPRRRASASPVGGSRRTTTR